MGVNVPNFGPGTAPGLLRRWAQTVEGLGFDLLMISDHIAVPPDVAEQILGDLTELQLLGTDTVVLDPFNGDPDETRHPEAAWHALAAVSATARHLGEQP